MVGERRSVEDVTSGQFRTARGDVEEKIENGKKTDRTYV